MCPLIEGVPYIEGMSIKENVCTLHCFLSLFDTLIPCTVHDIRSGLLKWTAQLILSVVTALHMYCMCLQCV